MKYLMTLFAFLCLLQPAHAQDEVSAPQGRILTIQEFVETATRNDATFEVILMDHLRLQHLKDFELPAGDWLASVKSEYQFFLSENREEPETTIGLNKLFPSTGTATSLAYQVTPSASGDTTSRFTALITQPIAENAFGKATRLRDKILGLEIEVSRHQIIEAYEDYLASLLSVYYNWYAAYESLKIGRSSYEQSLRLLDNIKDRQKQSIALPIDVNKIMIQVLSRKETLIELEEQYESIRNVVEQAVRYSGESPIVPADPLLYEQRDILFEEAYADFQKNSRTYDILNKLEAGSSLQVEKDADDLLPSTNLLFGYEASGDEAGLEAREDFIFAGVEIVWPLTDQVERADYEIAKIAHQQTKLANENKYVQLYTDLRNLYIQLERERTLVEIAEERIELAEAIFEDESENYSYGRVSLNDFIVAVNRVDDSRFNRVFHAVQVKLLITEWLRLSDQLVAAKTVLQQLDKAVPPDGE